MKWWGLQKVSRSWQLIMKGFTVLKELKKIFSFFHQVRMLEVTTYEKQGLLTLNQSSPWYWKSQYQNCKKRKLMCIIYKTYSLLYCFYSSSHRLRLSRHLSAEYALLSNCVLWFPSIVTSEFAKIVIFLQLLQVLPYTNQLSSFKKSIWVPWDIKWDNKRYLTRWWWSWMWYLWVPSMQQ